MHYVWWGVFILSLISLAVLMMRNKTAASWAATMGIHVVLAAVLLYAVNWFGDSYSFHIPINPGSMATIGILGVPGLMLLVAVKMSFV